MVDLKEKELIIVNLKVLQYRDCWSEHESVEKRKLNWAFLELSENVKTHLEDQQYKRRSQEQQPRVPCPRYMEVLAGEAASLFTSQVQVRASKTTCPRC